MKTNANRTPQILQAEHSESANNEDDIHVLSIEKVCEALDKGKTFVYSLVKQGRLAAPIKLGRSSAWQRRDLRAYLDRCIKESRAG
jgi:predicted DNA-binding transcriptional regulator AlpA